MTHSYYPRTARHTRVPTSNSCRQLSLEVVQRVFFESVPLDSQAVKYTPPIWRQWQWRSMVACCWYTLLLSLEQWEILGTHVTLAGVQFRHKSPLLGEPGVAIRAMSHQWCS